MARSMTRFGAAVERICSANSLTQRQIAEEIGVAPETVTRWKDSFAPPADELFRAVAVLRRYEPDITAETLVGHAAE